MDRAPVVEEVVVVNGVNALAFAEHAMCSYRHVADAGLEPRASPFARHRTACNTPASATQPDASFHPLRQHHSAARWPRRQRLDNVMKK